MRNLFQCIAVTALVVWADGSVWTADNSPVNRITLNGDGGGYWYGTPDGSYTPEDFSTITDYLAATLTLSSSSSYAAIGFDWDSAGGAVDLSEKSSFCIEYLSNDSVSLVMKESDIDDACPQYIYTLPKQTKSGIVQIPFTDFSLESWTSEACSTPTGANHESQTGLLIEKKTTGIVNLSIWQIGFGDECATSSDAASSSVDVSSDAASSSVDVSSDAASSSVDVSSDAASSSVDVSSDAASSSVDVSSDAASSSVDVSSSEEEVSSASGNPTLVWDPSLGKQVQFDGADGGYWYDYSDGNGGSVTDNISIQDGSLDSLYAKLAPGSASSVYAAVGFDWVDNGEDVSNEDKEVVDLTEHESMCITYTASKALYMVFKQRDVGDACPQYYLTLPVRTSKGTAELFLSGAKLENWSATGCDATQDYTLQTGVHFQYKTKDSSSIFKIWQIGFDGDCGDADVTVGLSSAKSSSSKAISSSANSSSSNATSVASSAASSATATSVSSATATSSTTSVSSSGYNSLCKTTLPGDTVIWMLADDNGDGVPNYEDSTHTCYVSTSILAGNRVDASGFGFIKLTSREISFRTQVSGFARVDVFTISGHWISSVFKGSVAQGIQHSMWEGSSLPEGVYLFRLQQGRHVKLVRAVLTH
ncbi:MAG TPA: hypothetical protein VLM37_01405 [Fibrobacteraceae bacterium]|nr:hypothetical protein [Fibrobacteraceae bacterium]